MIVASTAGPQPARAAPSAARARRRAARVGLLAERVELLGPMLDTAPIGIALMDRDLRFRYVNEHFAEFTGAARSPTTSAAPPGNCSAPEIGRVADEVVGRRCLTTGEPERDDPRAGPRGRRRCGTT